MLKFKRVVIDTGAYMRSTHLDRYGESLYTTPKVALEIKKFKDDPTRLFIRSIESIKIEEPEDSDIILVKSFAKSTGDLPYLSESDISAIALTCKFFREFGGVVKTTPTNEIKFLEPKVENNGKTKSKPVSDDSGLGFNKWINKSNLNKLPGEFIDDSEITSCDVACMTTDYSMQNVMLQMGLFVITIDGFAIKTFKRWGLICRACYFTTSNSTLLFCEKCGNSTLDKIPITISNDNTVIACDKRKYINNRGTIYSIPKQQGGRYANNLILAEDQMLMPGFIHNMRAKNRSKKDSVEHFNLTEPIVDSVKTYDKLRTHFTGDVKVGYGKGNPNSNMWIKKHRIKT